MPKYVIHVGPHKTGSTYLQLAFHELREFFADHGILYPKRWHSTPSDPNHRRLFSRLRSGGDEYLRRDFAEMNNSKYDKILISAEDLSNLLMSELDLLRSLVEDSDLVIVYYCRRWSERLPSLWQEWIKQGQSFLFPEYYCQETEYAENSRIINFAIWLDKVSSTFGMEKINLVSYSNILDQKGDTLKHFIEYFLSIKDFPAVSNKRVNTSLDLADTEMIRLLNALEWTAHRRRNHRMRDKYLESKKTVALAAFSMAAFCKAISDNISFFSIDDAAPPFASLYNQLYEKFGKLLVNPMGKNQLFDPHRHQICTRYLMCGRITFSWTG